MSFLPAGLLTGSLGPRRLGKRDGGGRGGGVFERLLGALLWKCSP